MLTYTGAFLLGILSASIIKYLSDVLPIKRKITVPVCVYCYRDIRWEAYLFQTKCPQCGRKFKIRRWIIYGLYPIIIILTLLNPSPRFGFWIAVVVLVYSGVVFVIDLEHRAILHPTSIFGALIFLLLGIYLHSFWNTILGGLAGFGIMLLLHYLGAVFGKWVAKRRGQVLDEPALGFGDVNLAGVLGLALGWPGILAGLFLAILLGGIISGFYLLFAFITKQYRPFLAVPYAPFMIAAALFLLFRP